MRPFLSKNWVVAVLPAVIIFAVFGRTVWFDYVQLDENIILANNWSFVSKISNFFEVFKHDINYPSNVAPYYRPIFILSFMLNTQFGSNPMVFHLGSILLHIAATYFVFWLFLELGFKKEISFFSALLFAVHPAVTPVAAWVPGRIEAILAIFTILSLIMFMRFLKTVDWHYLAGFFASFTIALLTKETVLGLIPVLFFYYLMHKKEKGSEMLTILSSGLGAIIVVWFFVRKSILVGANVVDVTFWQTLSMIWSNFAAAILYLGKTILPFNMSVFPVLNDSTLFYGFAALIVVAIIAGFTILRGRTSLYLRSDLKIQALGLLWFLGFLIPSLIGLYPTEKMVFFEHRLYLHLIGVLIFFVPIWSAFRFHREFSTKSGRSEITKSRICRFRSSILDRVGTHAFGVGTIVLFAILSFNYSGFYRDKLTFWERAVADSPTSPQGQKGLATAYLADNRIDEANERFAKTLELNPKEKGVHLLLGLYYLEQEQYDKGVEELEKEIEIDPIQLIAHHNLGRVFAQRRNYKEAEKHFLKTVEIKPDYILARQDLVVLYFSQNKHSQAIIQLKELLRIQRPEAMHPQILKILETYAEETVLQKGL